MRHRLKPTFLVRGQTYMTASPARDADRIHPDQDLSRDLDVTAATAPRQGQDLTQTEVWPRPA